MYGLLTEVYAVCKAAMRADQKLSKVWYGHFFFGCIACTANCYSSF